MTIESSKLTTSKTDGSSTLHSYLVSKPVLNCFRKHFMYDENIVTIDKKEFEKYRGPQSPKPTFKPSPVPHYTTDPFFFS